MNEAELIIDNLSYCNRERFNGVEMLAHRTLHEFNAFVSQIIFFKDSEEHKFAMKQTDIYPNTYSIVDFKLAMLMYSQLFKRWYIKKKNDGRLEK